VAQAADRELSGEDFGGGGGGWDDGPRDDRDVEARSRGPSKASRWGWLDLAVELDGAQRDFVVPINSSIDTSGREQARFNSSVYPEAGARLAIYPGAIFTDGWAAGFGLEGSFHHHVYMSILNQRQSEEVTAEEYSFTAGAVYRAVLGTADRGATIRARVGYGRFSFFLGDVANDIIPPMTYDHVYVALGAHVPLGTRYAGVDLGAGYLAVLAIGEEATMAYNQSGSAPSSNGFTFAVGASGQIYRGLRWRIGFEMLGFVTEVGVGRGWGVQPSTVIGGGGEGIETTGPAVDVHWRLIPSLVYRFGWSPDPPATSSSGAGGGRWYDGDREERPAFAAVDEDDEDDWDEGGW
jgi:hypothetical protein